MSFYQKRKPQETFRHHKSLMTQKQNYELYENQPQGLLLLEEALEIFGGGGSMCPEDKKPHVLPA